MGLLLWEFVLKIEVRGKFYLFSLIDGIIFNLI